MKINEPIGNTVFAPFFVRIAVGFYLLLEGKAKLSMHNGLVIPDFVREIKTLTVMPDQIATVYAILLPYLQISFGVLLIIGLWMTLSAGLSALLLCSMIYMWGMYTSINPLTVHGNVVILISTLSLLYSGAGAISVDRFRKGG